MAEYWSRFDGCTTTQTRDTSAYGYHYLSGLLRLEIDRTIANISRTAGMSEQNMHHYISESPWSAQYVNKMVRQDIASHLHFEKGSILILDESADDKAGKQSAGAGRQYNGRRGKVDQCQVGVFLALAKDGLSCRIDGELFLPEEWFTDAYADVRRRVGVPKDRQFLTKPEIGQQLIVRAQQEGIRFDAVTCDELDGRSFAFRKHMNESGIEYYADIPANTRVYLSQPQIGVPENNRGPKATKPQVISSHSYRVDELCHHPGKSDFGWDEFQATKLRAWEHQLTFTILAQWFIIETRLDWEALLKCSGSGLRLVGDYPGV